MREKIAMWLHSKERSILKVTFEASPVNVSWEQLDESWREHFRKEANWLLSLLKEEIKKSLLTGEEIRERTVRIRGLYYPGGIGYEDKLTEFGKDASQAQLDKVLKIVEEK